MSKHRHEMAYTAIQKSSGLPAGYTRLEYVTSNATLGGYIDTGVIPEIDGTFELRVYRRDRNPPFSSDYLSVYINVDSEKWQLFYANTKDMGTRVLPYSWRTLRYESKKMYQYTDDGELEYTLSASTRRCSKSLDLFRRKNSGTRCDCDISYFKMTRANGYTLEYIPALRNSDGVVGFYDIANGVFIPPTSGTFVAGPSL